MKSKKILALALAAIVASGGISQMTTQVYANDECSIAESMSIVRPSAALKLTKRSATCSYWPKMLGDAERYVDKENLFASSNNKLFFSINNEFEVKLVRCCDGSENVVIPQRVCIKDQEYNVTAIGEYAFKSKRKLKSVILPNSITEIGYRAFADCKHLNSIKLSNSITKIGKDAFRLCENLQLKELPNNITEIGEEAFCNTNIKSIEIPASVTILGKDSFETPTITKIKIANTSQWNENKKKYVCGEYSNNVKLVKINTQASKKSEIPCLLKVTDVNAMRNFVFENSENLFYDYKNKLIFEIGENAESVLVTYYGNQENLVVPEKFYIDDQEYNVTSIGESAFKNNKNLKSVELPDSIKEIGDGAFRYCTDLRLTKLPDEVKKIGDDAFKGCENLQLNILPNKVTEIGKGAFSSTNISNIYIPASVTKLDEGSLETSSINVICKDAKSNLTNDDLARACGTYLKQTILSTYGEKQTSEQIEESKIDDVTDEITMLTHRKIADGISKDIAEKEAEEALDEVENEIEKETLDGKYGFLAGKKRSPYNSSECNQMYQF